MDPIVLKFGIFIYFYTSGIHVHHTLTQCPRYLGINKYLSRALLIEVRIQIISVRYGIFQINVCMIGKLKVKVI